MPPTPSSGTHQDVLAAPKPCGIGAQYEVNDVYR